MLHERICKLMFISLHAKFQNLRVIWIHIQSSVKFCNQFHISSCIDTNFLRLGVINIWLKELIIPTSLRKELGIYLQPIISLNLMVVNLAPSSWEMIGLISGCKILLFLMLVLLNLWSFGYRTPRFTHCRLKKKVDTLSD